MTIEFDNALASMYFLHQGYLMISQFVAYYDFLFLIEIR
jgi:hypothetical protein